MDDKDYYGILGISKGASQGDVRAAYRRLARQCHPDVNPDDCGAEERFKAINEAYEVLSDPTQRDRYDATSGGQPRYYREPRRAAKSPSPATGWGFAPGAAWPGSGRRRPTVLDEPEFPGFADLDHPAEAPWSRPYAGSRAARSGVSAEVIVELTPAEAALGSSRTLGIVSPDGRSRQLDVRIPPGVGTGTRLRLSGPALYAYSGGQIEDLELVVVVRPSRRFG
jgi:DnaJ-class molecular chaperone